MRHLSTETILDQMERMDRMERRAGSPDLQASRHLGECRACAAEAARLGSLVQFMASDAANDPPTRVMEWAAGIFQPVLTPAIPGRESVFGRIARLVFDSFEQPLPAGVRSVTLSGPMTRKLLYRAGDVDIDVRVETDRDNRVSLSGQVLSDSPEFFENAPIRLESRGQSPYETATNPIGEFSFDGIPQNTYHLSMELPGGPVKLFCVYRDPLNLRN
jgi:hypothetical protein